MKRCYDCSFQGIFGAREFNGCNISNKLMGKSLYDPITGATLPYPKYIFKEDLNKNGGCKYYRREFWKFWIKGE